MDTPEISCWCLADTSRSLTMKMAYEAGTEREERKVQSVGIKGLR
jgi:hypothetical protein